MKSFTLFEASMRRAGEAEATPLSIEPEGDQVSIRWPFKRMAPGDVFHMRLPAEPGVAYWIRNKADTARRKAEKNGAQFARVREGAVLTYTRVG